MSKKLIIIVASSVVLVAAAAGAGYYFTRAKKPPAEGAEAAAAEAKAKKEEPTGLLEMETFLANISDASGERFAKLSVKLAISPSATIPEIEEDPLLMAKMRDRVLTLLTSKSYQDLSDPLGKEAFRSEIRLRLGPLLEESEIKEVLFGEFVVQ